MFYRVLLTMCVKLSIQGLQAIALCTDWHHRSMAVWSCKVRPQLHSIWLKG